MRWGEIYDMPAGRDLDRLIAEKVMDWGDFWTDPQGILLYGNPPHNTIEDDRIPVPYYSTDMSAAWTIVEKLRDMWTAATEPSSGWQDDFEHPFDDHEFFERLHRWADRRWPWAFLYVTPHDICRAALLAYPGVVDKKEGDE